MDYAIRKLYKRVPDEKHGGTISIPDGAELIDYQYEVDIQGLRAMAIKAASNKSQKSIDGPVTVKVRARKRVA